MPPNTEKRKTIKCQLPRVDVPEENVPKLPYNGQIVQGQCFSFSFSCFDHTHKLFNLGGKEKDKTVGGRWFIKLLDCLKSIGQMTTEEAKRSKHDLHPERWDKANTKPPEDDYQKEYWQFRLDKSSGRVIGPLIDGVFYVVWLDPHHNLSDSEGYEGIKKFPAP